MIAMVTFVNCELGSVLLRSGNSASQSVVYHFETDTLPAIRPDSVSKNGATVGKSKFFSQEDAGPRFSHRLPVQVRTGPVAALAPNSFPKTLVTKWPGNAYAFAQRQMSGVATKVTSAIAPQPSMRGTVELSILMPCCPFHN